MKDAFVHQLFQFQADRFPQRIAIEQADEKISFEELNTWSDHIGNALAAVGFDVKKIAGVIMPPGIDLVASALAIFKTGGIYLPIDSRHAQKRLAQIFADCNPSVLITTSEFRDDVVRLMSVLNQSNYRLIVLEKKTVRLVDHSFGKVEESVLKNVRQNTLPTLSEEDGCYIFYTSGSTGKAKAILGTHKGLTHFIKWEKKEFNVNENTRVSQLVQLTFDASLRDIFLPLCSGGTLCIPPRDAKENSALLISWLSDSNVTLIHTVPSLFRLLTRELQALKSGPTALTALQYVLLSGEPLYTKDISRWREVVPHPVQLVNLYGATETTLIKTFYRIKDIGADPSQILPVGIPIENTMIAIINHDHICRVGEIGEVYIKTNYATKGYLNDEHLTANVFVQNPLVKDRIDIVYRTGDLGRYLKTNDIEILGRIDNQIKVNGIRVELEEINRAVLAVENVTESFVVAYHEETGTEVVCYYTCDGMVAEIELIDHLTKSLNPGSLPNHFVRMEVMPLNANGKIDRLALPKPSVLSVELSNAELPQGEVERTLASIWEAVLVQTRIGRHCSFFKKGGTSLRAMQVISRIYKKYQVLITVADLFNNPTVRELAQRVNEKKQSTNTIELQSIEEQDHYPVSNAQKRYWLASKTDLTQIFLNVPSSFVLRGTIDIEALDFAFRSLVTRHESLRSSFLAIGKEVRSRVFEAQDHYAGIEIADFTNAENPSAEAELFTQRQASKIFDLEHGPLIKVALLKLGEAHYVLVFTLHHIISDGWSMAVLARELLTFYNAHVLKNRNTLAPLPVQYKDINVWHSKLLSGKYTTEHQEFWWNQFMNLNYDCYIPTDLERKNYRTFQGDSLAHVFSREQTKRLKDLADRFQTSTFVTLVAMLNALLYKYSGQRNIVVGTESVNRGHRDLEGQIGIYLNTVVLTNMITPEERFSTWINSVKSSVYNAFKYQAYPFDRLLDDLKIPYNPNRFPLFDILIQMQNLDVDKNSIPDMEGVIIDKFPVATTISKFDLSFKFFERNDRLALTLEFNRNLYVINTIEQLQDNFVHLVTTFLDSPDMRLVDFLLLKRDAVLESVNNFLEVSSDF